MTQAIVEGAVASQEDMQVVGRSANASLGLAVRQHNANVVIVNERAISDDLHVRIVGTNPKVKVVGITDEGGNASLYEFRTVRLADPSPTSLVALIRDALREDD